MTVDEFMKKLEETGKFNEPQMNVIYLGLIDHLDISFYAKPELDYRQMQEIRKGLGSGIDVSTYAKPELHWAQMQEIRKGLESSLVAELEEKEIDNDILQKINLF